MDEEVPLPRPPITQVLEYKDSWRQKIEFHLNAIGAISGLTVTGLAAFVSLEKVGFSEKERLVIFVAVTALALQIILWLQQVKNDRNIAWKEYELLRALRNSERDIVKKKKQEIDSIAKVNTKWFPLLELCIHVSFLSVLVLILFKLIEF